MATEPNFNAVPPVSLIADGTSEGIIQVVDTIGFYIKMQATLRNNQGASLTVYVKRVVDANTIWVGATKGNMLHDANCSSFTVITGATMEAAEQPKHPVSMEAQRLSTYENDPVDAWRTTSVDPYGDKYTGKNPAPVNIWSTAQFPFTFGMLGIPDYVQTLLNGITYDTVISSTSGTTETLTFYDAGSLVDTLSFTKTANGWMLNVISPATGFLELESGGFILQEDGGHILV